VIIVVEGVSAAGKSTWCRLHYAEQLVPELPSAVGHEDALDDAARQEFWASLNSDRWQRALRQEEATGLAVCDTDPLKLHYTWGLWQLGKVDRESWDLAVSATRRRVAAGVLGFADLVLVSEVPPEELASRRERDAARTGSRRGKFDLHLQIAHPLRAWYEAIERLEPGRVRWTLPPSGDLSPLPEARQQRSGAELFDDLLVELPAW